MNSSEIKTLIEAAFQNVTLDGGVSQLQSQVMDNYGEGVTTAEFNRLPRREVTNDWKAFPVETFFSFSYLDAKGFRYYIPALMTESLEKGVWIGETISALYPKNDHLREHRFSQYALLNPQQRVAITQFLSWLSHRVELDHHYQVQVERALRNYWHQYV